MMRPTLYRLALGFCAALGLAAPQARAGLEFIPVPTFAVTRQEPLDIAPTKTELDSDIVYLLGTNAAGIDVIELRDALSLQPILQQPLEMTADDMVVAPGGDTVFVIGNDGKSSRIAILDAKLQPLGTIDVGERVGYPTLSLTHDGHLVVGALRTDFSDGFFAVYDVRNPTAPEFRSDLRAFETYRGVTGAWLDLRSFTVFANASYDARLFALALGKERILSDFSEGGLSKSGRAPYAVSAQLGGRACRQGAGTSFIIADMERSTIALLDYNDSFQSLDPLDYFDFSLAPTRAILRRLDGTTLSEPAGVVSSSCDQSVILVGSRASFEVEQFARNQGLARLENVGSLNLPVLPQDIDVAADGSYAIAVSTRDRQILLMGPDVPEEGISLRIIGDSDVREVQRLLTQAGFNVGAIDGIVGARTMRAAELAQNRLGIALDVRNDPAGAAAALQDAMSNRKN